MPTYASRRSSQARRRYGRRRALMWKDAVFAAGQEDRVELQAFGRVQRHQGAQRRSRRGRSIRNLVRVGNQWPPVPRRHPTTTSGSAAPAARSASGSSAAASSSSGSVGPTASSASPSSSSSSSGTVSVATPLTNSRATVIILQVLQPVSLGLIRAALQDSPICRARWSRWRRRQYGVRSNHGRRLLRRLGHAGSWFADEVEEASLMCDAAPKLISSDNWRGRLRDEPIAPTPRWERSGRRRETSSSS